jgi:hypothetical protein
MKITSYEFTRLTPFPPPALATPTTRCPHVVSVHRRLNALQKQHLDGICGQSHHAIDLIPLGFLERAQDMCDGITPRARTPDPHLDAEKVAPAAQCLLD